MWARHLHYTHNLSGEPPPPVEADHTALWVGVGAGALAAGSFAAGLILALEAQADLDALRAQLGDPPRVVRGSDEHRRLQAARDAADAGSNRTRYTGLAARVANVSAALPLPPAGRPPLLLHVGNEVNACNEWRCSAGSEGAGGTLEEFVAIEAREDSSDPNAQQLSATIALADHVLINDGELADVERRVDALLGDIDVG